MTFHEKMQKLNKYIQENRMQLDPREILALQYEAMALFSGRLDKWDYFTDNFILYLEGKDLFKTFADYVSTKTNLVGKTILDVGAGTHCLSSVELRNKGADVVAMDPVAAPKYNNGFSIMNCSFNQTMNIKGIDIVTCVRGSKECCFEVLMAFLHKQLKFVILFPNYNKDSVAEKLRVLPNVKTEYLDLSIPYLIATNF
ncbi:MAG: hypothetical protein FWC79_03545 [Oscillospiraceae bacterium]|nr:hypothetical protein [Oscillospiraceae bacterium]